LFIVRCTHGCNVYNRAFMLLFLFVCVYVCVCVSLSLSLQMKGECGEMVDVMLPRLFHTAQNLQVLFQRIDALEVCLCLCLCLCVCVCVSVLVFARTTASLFPLTAAFILSTRFSSSLPSFPSFLASLPSCSSLLPFLLFPSSLVSPSSF
jgi:hypothetical protein